MKLSGNRSSEVFLRMNKDVRGERKICSEERENIKGLISARQSVILYDAEASNPISIHISISQPSGSQFETVEEVLSRSDERGR